uniref:Uncharacterized protein n=1 Tax=Arundo donax TaxID=35708 RepID=A0A0A9G942_ARUDO
MRGKTIFTYESKGSKPIWHPYLRTNMASTKHLRN